MHIFWLAVPLVYIHACDIWRLRARRGSVSRANNTCAKDVPLFTCGCGFAVTKFLNRVCLLIPTSSVGDVRPLPVLENFLGYTSTIARPAVELHRVTEVGVREGGQLSYEFGVVLDLESVCTSSMSRVPLALCAHVDHNRTSAVRG